MTETWTTHITLVKTQLDKIVLNDFTAQYLESLKKSG